MTSRRLFADLLKENNKRRLWPIALSIAGNFFAQIVYAFLLLGVYADRLADGRTVIEDVRLDAFQNLLGFSNIPVVLLIIGFAFINAMQGFSFLFDSRMSDLYGSLPVKKEKLFNVVTLNGIFVFVIPYIICHIITMIVVMMRGYITTAALPVIFANALTAIVIYILYYMTCILAAILTGHIVVAVLGAITFFSIGPAIYYAIKFYMAEFFFSYYFAPESKLVTWLSPFSLGTTIIAENFGLSAIQYSASILVKTVAALAIAAILYLICIYLFKKRPAEAAGRAMSFKVTKPFIKSAIILTAALYGGLFFFTFNENVFSLIFGIVCTLIVGHAIMETIYEFDFKASFSHFGSLIVSFAIAAGILCIFVFDPFGYESWLPATKRVESCAVATGHYYSGIMNSVLSDDGTTYLTNEDYQIKTMKITDVSLVEPLTEAGAKYAKQEHLRRVFNKNAYMNLEENDGNYVYLNIKWNLKGGKQVYRTYYVNSSDLAVAENLKNLYNSEEFKLGYFGILGTNNYDFSKVSYDNLSGTHDFSLERDEYKGLIEAYRKDVLNQSYDDLINTEPLLEMNLYQLHKRYRYEELVYNIFVYDNFTETKAFLESHKMDTDWKSGFDQVGKLEITFYDDAMTTWKTTDAQEIKTILEHAKPNSLFNVNTSVKKSDDDKVVYAEMLINGANTQSFAIYDFDMLPQNFATVVNRVYSDLTGDAACNLNTNVGWNGLVSAK